MFQRSSKLLEPLRRPPMMACQQLLFPGAPPDPFYRPNQNGIVVDYYPGGVEEACVAALSVVAARNMELQSEMARIEDNLRSLTAEHRLQRLDIEILSQKPDRRSDFDSECEVSLREISANTGAADTRKWLSKAAQVEASLRSMRPQERDLRPDALELALASMPEAPATPESLAAPDPGRAHRAAAAPPARGVRSRPSSALGLSGCHAHAARRPHRGGGGDPDGLLSRDAAAAAAAEKAAATDMALAVRLEAEMSALRIQREEHRRAIGQLTAPADRGPDRDRRVPPRQERGGGIWAAP
jgi:hypothetical protein